VRGDCGAKLPNPLKPSRAFYIPCRGLWGRLCKNKKRLDSFCYSWQQASWLRVGLFSLSPLLIFPLLLLLFPFSPAPFSLLKAIIDAIRMVLHSSGQSKGSQQAQPKLKNTLPQGPISRAILWT